MGTQLTARVDDDFAELVDDWRERERMESQSEAVRELLRIGLKEENAWFETTADGGLTAKEWAAARVAKWADRTMYAALLSGILGATIGVPTLLNWVEPTVPLAFLFFSAYALMATFALVGGLLSLVWIGLYLWMGVGLKEALPWRRPA